MPDATGKADAKQARDSADTGRRLVCPHCKALYRPHRPTQGRRVRCQHCGHVWRDDSEAIGEVAGALGTAATTWARSDSTMLAATDHASSVGRMASQLAEPPQLIAAEWIGRSLGRYRIKAILGEGTMGYVYEARDNDLNRLVALKVLPRRVDSQSESLGLRMFLQEASVAAKIQHPNVVMVYEVGQQDDIYFFAMERVHGTTLSRLIAEHGSLPARQVCYIVAHAARALAAGHAMGIVHRDVKPGNIMIDTSGHVKVTDFGLADVTGIEGVRELSERPLGTPGWISPEVARGERASPASDIYGLGLTLHHALTNDRLIKAESRSAMIHMQRQAKSVQGKQLPESWPPRLRDIVLQCLQADPRNRYQSAETLAADLLRALAPDEADATVVLGDDQAEGPRLVPPAVSWLVLSLLTLVAAYLAVWWWLLR